MRFLYASNDNYSRQLFIDVPPRGSGLSTKYEITDNNGNVLETKVTFSEFLDVVHNGYKCALVKLRGRIGEGAIAITNYLLVDFEECTFKEIMDMDNHDVLIKSLEL